MTGTPKQHPLRRLWIACALLLSLLAVSLLHGWHVKQITEEVESRLASAQSRAEAGEWETAAALTRDAYRDWERNRAYVYILLQHAEADEILRSFQSVQEYVNLQELDQYAAENADLRAQLRLLAEQEQPSLLNVL